MASLGLPLPPQEPFLSFPSPPAAPPSPPLLSHGSTTKERILAFTNNSKLILHASSLPLCLYSHLFLSSHSSCTIFLPSFFVSICLFLVLHSLCSVFSVFISSASFLSIQPLPQPSLILLLPISFLLYFPFRFSSPYHPFFLPLSFYLDSLFTSNSFLILKFSSGLISSSSLTPSTSHLQIFVTFLISLFSSFQFTFLPSLSFAVFFIDLFFLGSCWRRNQQTVETLKQLIHSQATWLVSWVGEIAGESSVVACVVSVKDGS